MCRIKEVGLSNKKYYEKSDRDTALTDESGRHDRAMDRMMFARDKYL